MSSASSSSTMATTGGHERSDADTAAFLNGMDQNYNLEGNFDNLQEGATTEEEAVDQGAGYSAQVVSLSKLRSVKTVLTRRANEWMQSRLTDLAIEMFGVERIVIFSTHAVEPPGKFQSVWHFVGEHHATSRLSADESRALEGADAVLIFCDTQADEHMQDALAIATSIGSLGGPAPPILLLHHSMAPELRPQTDEPSGLEDFDTWSAAMDAGIDDVVLTESSGMRLAAEVQSRISQQKTLAKGVIDKVIQRQKLVDHVFDLEDAVSEIVWVYFRQRLATGLPGIDEDIPPGIPESINGNLVGNELGSGSFGTVFRLNDPIDNSSCGEVVKVMSKESLTDFHGIASIKRHIGVMTLLSSELHQHNNIAKLYDVYHTDTHILFLMEDCGAMNLFSRLNPRQRDLSIQQVTSIIDQCVQGLHHLHEHAEVVHRDIKPENLVISEDRNGTIVKYVDFDTSRSASHTLVCRGICGTYPFMAPDMMGDGNYSPRPADIWSLAIVFLEITCRLRVLNTVLGLYTAPRNVTRAQRNAAERYAIGQIGTYFEDTANVGVLVRNHCRPELAEIVEDTVFLLEGMLKVAPADRSAAPQVLEVHTARFGPRLVPTPPVQL